MKPVDQTKFVPDPRSDECGNCMQAAYASILELPLDEVPHFAATPGENGEWFDAVLTWCAARGYAVVQSEEPIPGVLCLMSGKSPRGDFDHLVVGRDRDVLHDPHPSRAGLAGDPVVWWYLLPHEPVA